MGSSRNRMRSKEPASTRVGRRVKRRGRPKSTTTQATAEVSLDMPAQPCEQFHANSEHESIDSSEQSCCDLLISVNSDEEPAEPLGVHDDDEFRDMLHKEKLRFRRMAIAYQFLYVHNFPSENTWAGANGVANKIRTTLHLGPNTINRSVILTMTSIRDTIYSGLRYDGRKSNHYCRGSTTEDQLISVNSFEAQLIADCKENDISLRSTMHIVNAHRSEIDKGHVGYSTIWRTYQQLRPIVTPIKKRKQGSCDQNSPWAKASLRWCTQLLIRFGKLPTKEIENIKRSNNGILPEMYDITKLPELSLHNICFFDETHKKVREGKVGTNGQGQQVRFPRNPITGEIDLQNGIYAKEERELKMKYSEECRLCLGVAKKISNSGVDVGVRLPYFDYTGKSIVTRSQYESHIEATIRRVKTLKPVFPWVVPTRPQGAIYESDSPSILKGIGLTITKHLASMNICTVLQFYNKLEYNKELRTQLITGVARLTTRKLTDFLAQASKALPGDPPPKMDYRQAANPFKARFGEDNWRKEVAQSHFMKCFVCVEELIEYMYSTSREFFRGTKYEANNNWYFYHDALSLMTAQETKNWMEQKGYLKHWILPMLNLNVGTPYNGRPIGNRPELMPLDNSLNKDVDDCVLRHVAITSHLARDDPKRFMLNTPKNIQRAYTRCWNQPAMAGVDGMLDICNGALSSQRIVSDINKFETALLEIFKAKGTVIKDCAVRSGHRGEESRAAKINKWGGVRIKKETAGCESWLHPDALAGKKTFFEASIKRWGNRCKQKGENNDTNNATMNIADCSDELDVMSSDNVDGQMDGSDVIITLPQQIDSSATDQSCFMGDDFL